MIKRVGIGCMLGFILLIFGACSRNTDIYLEEYEKDACVDEPTDGKESVCTEILDTEDAEDETVCYVYICGAVVQPGVYAMADGSRIYEVIEVAGGVTDEADETLVNQAEPVRDGMMIRIYTMEEVKSLDSNEGGVLSESGASDGRIDINSAGVAELMTLPGIGSAKAETIVTYRKEHGAFLRIEDLMNIPGIKEGIFRQIKEHIKVNK